MANLVGQFTLKFWNGSFYAVVKFPDGTQQELKSQEDLNWSGWQAKIDAAWNAIRNPPPDPMLVTVDNATSEQLLAELEKRGWSIESLEPTVKAEGLVK